jgi:hypothetical protein
MKACMTIAALLMAAPAFAVTANSATVAAGAQVQLANTGVDINPINRQTVAGAPAALSISAVASTPGEDGLNVSASSSVDATWASAKAGSATMNWGWESVSNGEQSVNTIAYPDRTNWTYRFTTGNAGGSFNANWSVNYDGDTFGIAGVTGFYNESPFNIAPEDIVDPIDRTGSFSVPLAANTSYSFGFGNFGNVGGGGPKSASAVFNFDWYIIGGGDTGVPEPASWAMLITGFGLTGAVARRRRQRSVAA